MDLLIYGPAIFAGIIGSRYLPRLANFCLMVFVFQLDITMLFGFSVGVFLPYTVLCIFPAIAGIVGEKYFRQCKYDLQIGSRYVLMGELANALFVIGVFYMGGVLLAFQNRRQFIPFLFLQAIFVSAGSLLPPLIFIVVAIVAYRFRFASS